MENNRLPFGPSAFSTDNPEKFIIDTDAGVDDGVAICVAIESIKKKPNAEIIALTCASGNTSLQNVKYNVIKTLEKLNRLDIPIYSGADRSFLPGREGDDFYGKDGFHDVYPDKPDLSIIQKEHAVNALIRLVNENPGHISIICLAPLTNIALAIRMDPTFKSKVRWLYILGGSVDGYGNMGPYLEFNFYMDPEAVLIVFEGDDDKPKIILLPLDPILLDGYTSIDWRKNQLGGIQTKTMDFLNELERIHEPKENRWHSADTALMTIIFNESVVKQSETVVVIPSVAGELRGGLIVDRNNMAKKKPNTILISKMDPEEYKRCLYETFS